VNYADRNTDKQAHTGSPLRTANRPTRLVYSWLQLILLIILALAANQTDYFTS